MTIREVEKQEAIIIEEILIDISGNEKEREAVRMRIREKKGTEE